MSDSDGQLSPENKKEMKKGLKKARSLRMLVGFLKPYKTMIVIALTALVVAAGATLSIFKSLELIVDKGFAAENAEAIDIYFLALLGVVVVLALATMIRFMTVTLLGERIVADLRKAVHKRLLSLHPAFFEENRPGEIASRLTADTSLIQSFVGSSLSVALRNFLMLIGGVIMLFMTSPKLMGLIALVVPVVIGPLVLFGRRVRKYSERSQSTIARIGAMADEALGAIQTVQAFTQEEEEARRFSGAVEDAYGVARKRVLARSLMTALVIFLIFGAIDLVLWQGAKDVILGSMTGGELASFVGLSVVVAGAVGALSEVYGELMRASGAAARLNELLNVEPDIRPPAVPKVVGPRARGAIAFEGIEFSYPTKPDIRALDNFSLSVQPGETVALVGPSGAGKSTVLQLLLRFFDPQTGRIVLDGVDIKDIDPRDLRRQMAVVPQDTIIFADTIGGNIRYGDMEADDESLQEAIRAAQCEEFIKALPNGLDTYLGERGVRLSGGQRQRVAIARAILKKAPILLLDEATSALDSEAEQKVQKALDHVMKGRTTLVIAHRLSTVTKADRIIVLENGKIRAEGTHDQLIATDALYAKLAELQFSEALTGS